MSTTVGDILDDMPDTGQTTAPKAAPPIPLATLPDTPPLPAPGIYFSMPEDEYHALPALGSHDIQRLCASPMLFWAGCTWLSAAARKREVDRKAKPEERAHRTVGRAYHCRLLEGPAEYAKRYAVELSAAECEGALESTDQIKAAIKAKGHKPVSKVPDTLPDDTPYERAAVKADWEAQLLAIDPGAKVLSALRAAHAQANAGKEFISFEAHEQIETAARMIEADDKIRHALQGGYPEVTLIWHDAETGAPCKARVDRLKLKAAVDLKSFANRGHRSPDSAIRGALHAYKYTVQPSHYLAGIQAVRGLVLAGGPKAPTFCYLPDGTIGGGIHIETANWSAKWARETDEPEWWWLFQQTGYAPITRLKRYSGGLSTRIATDEIRRQALRRFAIYAEAYPQPDTPWIDSAPPADITDDDFSDRIIEF